MKDEYSRNQRFAASYTLYNRRIFFQRTEQRRFVTFIRSIDKLIKEGAA